MAIELTNEQIEKICNIFKKSKELTTYRKARLKTVLFENGLLSKEELTELRKIVYPRIKRYAAEVKNVYADRDYINFCGYEEIAYLIFEVIYELIWGKKRFFSNYFRDKIERIGTLPNVEVIGWVDPDEYGYSRTYQFKLHNQIYNIVWYKNLSSVFVGGNTADKPHVFFRYINFDMDCGNSYHNLVFARTLFDKEGNPQVERAKNTGFVLPYAEIEKN